MFKIFTVALVLFMNNLYAMRYYSEEDLGRSMDVSDVVFSVDEFDDFNEVKHFIEDYEDDSKPDGYLEDAIACALAKSLRKGIVPKDEIESVQAKIWSYTTEAVEFGRVEALERVLPFTDDKQHAVSLGIGLMFLPSIERYAELTDFALANPTVESDVKRMLGEDAKLMRYNDIPHREGVTLPPLRYFKFSHHNLDILKEILTETTENRAKQLLNDVIDTFMRDEYAATVPERLK